MHAGHNHAQQIDTYLTEYKHTVTLSENTVIHVVWSTTSGMQLVFRKQFI